MAQHDPARERLHRRFEDVVGEPEATMLMDRLLTREDVREVVRSEIQPLRSEIELARRDAEVREERLRAEIHRVGRNQLLGFAAIVAGMNTALAAFSFFQA